MGNTTGKNIRHLRHKAGKNQKEVARRLNISVPGYSKIEAGITDISVKRLHQIARYFKVSPAEILSGVEIDSKLPEQKIMTELQAKLEHREQELFQLQVKLMALYKELKEEAKTKILLLISFLSCSLPDIFDGLTI